MKPLMELNLLLNGYWRIKGFHLTQMCDLITTSFRDVRIRTDGVR